MTAAATKRMTVAEYFAHERTALTKSEFYDGELFAMAGASVPHNQIKENLSGEFHALLKGKSCQSFSSDQRILVNRTGLYTYPDLVIVCGELQYDPHNDETITNPQVIFEVLSDSTERYDRTTKFRMYQQIPSLQEYILVSQHEPVCERFVRQADGSWGLRAYVGREATLDLATVDAQVKLADIFARTILPSEQNRESGGNEPKPSVF
jgi:Uma2 family endonuclease